MQYMYLYVGDDRRKHTELADYFSKAVIFDI